MEFNNLDEHQQCRRTPMVVGAFHHVETIVGTPSCTDTRCDFWSRLLNICRISGCCDTSGSTLAVEPAPNSQSSLCTPETCDGRNTALKWTPTESMIHAIGVETISTAASQIDQATSVSGLRATAADIHMDWYVKTM